MTKCILGFAGKIGSGKDTLAHYCLQKLGGQCVSFSDPLKEILHAYQLQSSRENLQKLSTLLRTHFSEDILAQGLEKKIHEASGPIVAITNVRRHVDVELLKKFQRFYLVYVEADPETRFQRYLMRNQSPGDRDMAFEEFQKNDTSESEAQIEGLKEKAHLVIKNNESIEKLYQTLKDSKIFLSL